MTYGTPILDYFLPPGFQHSFEKEFQGVSRLFILIMLFSSGLTFLFTCFYIYGGQTDLAVVTGCSCLAFTFFIYFLFEFLYLYFSVTIGV